MPVVVYSKMQVDSVNEQRKEKEKKSTDYTFGANLMRSQVLYQTAQVSTSK